MITDPRWATPHDHLLWVVQHAEYYTVVKFLGVGVYERYELREFTAAYRAAKCLVALQGGRYMIYAVAGPHDAYITTVA